ncbi:MAG TPA: tyrosine-type recombinase/integrase [Acidimicrobiia bacterium]|jgi:integrase|nr:tyrosine-type recombinase/integrase [Acidimicrobiia bacterium]
MSTQGSVYRRGKTWTWHLSWKEGGQQKQEKKGGFPTKPKAQAALAEKIESLRTGSYVPTSQLTVGGYLDTWLDSLAVTGHKPTTIAAYREKVRSYVRHSIGDLKLQEVTALHLDHLYEKLRTGGGKDGRPLAPATVRYVHAVLSKALGDAEREGLLKRNPARLASPPSFSSARSPEMKVWAPEELAAFLEQTADHHLSALFRLAALTGMRRGEICGLRWDAVDLDAATIQVTRTLTPVNGVPVWGEPKTRRSRRTVEIDPDTMRTLRAHRREQLELRVLVGSGWHDQNMVFCAPDGRPLHPDNVGSWFARAVAKSGLTRIRFHDLRHTHPTHLLAAGVNPRIVSERLGHSSVAFTLDTYGHVLPGQGAEAAALAAGLLGSAPTKRLPNR